MTVGTSSDRVLARSRMEGAEELIVGPCSGRLQQGAPNVRSWSNIQHPSTPLSLPPPPQDHTRVEKGDDKDTVRKKTVKLCMKEEHCQKIQRNENTVKENNVKFQLGRFQSKAALNKKNLPVLNFAFYFLKYVFDLICTLCML